MRQAGIREARQHLSRLIDEVRKGREIIITERGLPVARLLPLAEAPPRVFPDLADFRSKMPRLDPPLSATVLSERDEW